MIGSHILERLANHKDVEVIAISNTRLPNIVATNIEPHLADAREPDMLAPLLERVEYVIVCAGILATSPVLEANPVKPVLENVRIGIGALEAVFQARCRQCVWISSTTGYPPVLGLLEEGQLFEGNPPDRWYGIGWVTRFLETQCQWYAEKLPFRNTAYAILRPTMVYGEYDNFDEAAAHFLPSMIRRVVHREASIKGICPVILAGGKGTRLAGSLGELPKPLALVSGRSFIFFIFDILISMGFDRVVVSIGYNKSKFPELIGNKYNGLNLQYAEDGLPLDTAGAIKNSAQVADSENLLVFNGDSYCGSDLRQFISEIPLWAVAALVVTSRFGGNRYGSVSFDENGIIKSFYEKPACGDIFFVNAGIYWFSSEAVKAIPAGIKVSLERDSLPKMMSRGVYAWKTNEELVDIGTPESLQYAQSYFAGSTAVS